MRLCHLFLVTGVACKLLFNNRVGCVDFLGTNGIKTMYECRALGKICTQHRWLYTHISFTVINSEFLCTVSIHYRGLWKTTVINSDFLCTVSIHYQGLWKTQTIISCRWLAWSTRIVPSVSSWFKSFFAFFRIMRRRLFRTDGSS